VESCLGIGDKGGEKERGVSAMFLSRLAAATEEDKGIGPITRKHGKNSVMKWLTRLSPTGKLVGTHTSRIDVRLMKKKRHSALKSAEIHCGVDAMATEKECKEGGGF